MKYKLSGLCLAFWALSASAGETLVAAVGASERDYLSDLPLVLSVSRLVQPIDETPGAVTVIDADMIRLSGARNVAELMRLVPGFQVSDSFESIGPLVSYHGAFSDLANHVQVMVDGRSVYASYLRGSAMPGLQSLSLSDIQRIEVLRGSNSAAYGARAFLGVINIVTREPGATHGVQLEKSSGQNGVDDHNVRVGWGGQGMDFRVSAGRRADDGLIGASAGSSVGYLNLRADFSATPEDKLEVRAGGSDQDAGVGFTDQSGDLARNRHIGLDYLQVDWRRVLSADSDLLASVAHSDERYVDRFLLAERSGLAAYFFGTPVSASGVARSDTVNAQQTVHFGDKLRLVWGGELRAEAIRSQAYFNSGDWLTEDWRRLFANVEWRLRPDLVVNAGEMYERSSRSGTYHAPRTAVNWHVAPQQTLRVGVSRGFRPPSLYEQKSDVRFAATQPLPLPQATAAVTDKPLGDARAETLLSREIGYLASFQPLGLTADVRLFEERIRGLMARMPYTLTDLTLVSNVSCGKGISPPPFCANDFANGPNFPIRGHEIQLQWRPFPGTRLIANHAESHIDAADLSIAGAMADNANGLILFQQMPRRIDLSLMYFDASSQPWAGAGRPAWHRFDARIGKRFLVAGREAEAAIVLQNLGDSYVDYKVGSNELQFGRRAFLTLSLSL